MLCLTLVPLVPLLLAASSPAPSGWEKLYERPEKAPALVAVWADDTGWFASGPGLLVAGNAGGVKPEDLGKKTIVAFAGASRKELFAVGWDELILRLEGERWVEEHRALGLPTGEKSGRNVDDLLQSVATLPRKPQPLVVAVGPKLMLARHPDGFWQLPPDAEREAAARLAREGSPDARPKGCAPGAWSWVPGGRAVFTCRDGRGFVFDGGKATPAGKLPRSCKDAVDHARLHGAEAYTLCDGQLWRSQGARWKQVPAPAKLRDYALTARCSYAVTERAVWRRCSP